MVLLRNNGHGTSCEVGRHIAAAEDEPRMYMVYVSMRFLYLSLSASILLAFIIGRSARTILLEGPRNALLAPHDESVMFVRSDYHGDVGISSSQKKRNLPTPKLLEGKEIPRTLYTGRNFDTGASATVSSLHLEHKIDRDISVPNSQDEENRISVTSVDLCPVSEKGDNQCSRIKVTDGGDEKEEPLHLPAGQHLLVDIKNVDGEFLNSEERLALAMVEVITESKLTLLSYHCHSLVPMGVSCVGVLLESHISFHTWPEEGVITLDLYTCGSAPLVPVMPIITRLFAVPREGAGDSVEEPRLVWSHKLRGWGRTGDKKFLGADVGREVLEKMNYDMKEEVLSTTTKFQRIDIYDIIHPTMRDYLSYEKSLSNDGSYPSIHPELYRPDRVVYLDGIHQSSRYGLEAYHEALVHPAMFAHPEPRTAAIIGGGEGATIREVLKHDTIQKVKMIEIDEEMVQVSRDYLPEWSNCSDIKGSAGWCGDDARAELYYEDALAWFITRYGNKEKLVEETFDVIIMDALDPQDNVPFAEVLYKNDSFLNALYNSLSKNGVMVLQLGMAPSRLDPSEELSRNKNRDYLTNSLIEIGFNSLNIYHEPHCLFEKPWTYLVAMKDSTNRQLWYQNRPEFDVEIHRRIRRTHSGEPSLKYFDSTIMKSYEVPNKVYETVYCRKDPQPASCNSFDEDISLSVYDFEVQLSSVGEGSGRGLFTKVNIAEGTPIGLTESTENVFFPYSTVDHMELVLRTHYSADVKCVYDYMNGYGWEMKLRGLDEYGVDASILTFANHGCNGTHNIDQWPILGDTKGNFITEENFSMERFKVERVDRGVYDPYVDRHLPHIINEIEYATRDIVAGEEILCNYVDYTSNDEELDADVALLRAVCNGEKIGEITALEEVAEKDKRMKV